MASGETSTKRSVHNTSLDTSGNDTKRADIADETPNWAIQLFGRVDEVLAEVRDLKSTMVAINAKVEKVEEKASENAEHIRELQHGFDELKMENESLRGELQSVRSDLDGQIDRSLRDHISFFGVKKGENEKSWEDITKVVCAWLASHTGKEAGYYDQNIERCHRGPFNPDRSGPRPIFAKFRWRAAEDIRVALKNKQTDGVNIKDKYSRNTQVRINQALMYRRELRNEHPEYKLFVAYPARLMQKKPQDASYTLVKSF